MLRNRGIEMAQVSQNVAAGLWVALLWGAAAGAPLRAAAPPEPAAEVSEHRLRWMERIVLGDEILGDGDPASVPVSAMLNLDARGWPADLLRRSADDAADRLPFSAFHQVHGLLAVAEEDFSLPGKKTRPVVWHGEGRYLGLLTPVGGEALLRAPFWLPEAWVMAVRRPAEPVGEIRSLELRQVIVFAVPVGMPRLVLPAPAAGAGGGLRWSLAWAWQGQGRRRLEVRLDAVVEGGGADPARLDVLREELARLYRALGRGGRYEPAGE